MGKIMLGNKEFIPPPANPPPPQPPQPPIRKFTNKEILILIGVVLSLLTMGWLPTKLVYDIKMVRLEQKIDQLDPLNKIEINLNKKLDKLNSELKVEDDDLYKLLTELRNKRRLELLDQLDQIRSFKSKQDIITSEYFILKKEELKQKELLYHR